MTHPVGQTELIIKQQKKAVLSLKVVNDHAERGVAWVQRYNKLLKKTEEQFQFLLQVVSQYQKKFPDSRISTVVQIDKN